MAQLHVQQQDFSDLPLLNIVTEAVSANFTGGDLINGKLGYNITSNQLITVISAAIAKILTSQDLATGADLTAATVGKLIGADLIASSGDTPVNLDEVLPTLQKVVDEIIARTDGDITIRGGLVGNADLTGNSTGNTYLDGGSSVLAGDKFIITSSGSLTVSDGTIAVTTGDTITILNDKADASILVADVLYNNAGVINAIEVAFDNTGSNLASVNVEAAVKEVNAKFADSFYTVNNVAFTAGQIQTITHNLNGSFVECKVAVAGSGVFTEVSINSANKTLNSFEIQIDVAGSYDFVVRILTQA
jgi:hypothetical protein